MDKQIGERGGGRLTLLFILHADASRGDDIKTQRGCRGGLNVFKSSLSLLTYVETELRGQREGGKEEGGGGRRFQGGQLQVHQVRLPDRKPGKTDRRPIQRRRVIVYMSAFVLYRECACIGTHVCVRVCVYLGVLNGSELLCSIVTVHLSKLLSQLGTKLR